MSAAQRADHNRQKKIAAVNDLTGFGRCSLADRAFSKLLRETLDKAGCPLLSLEGDCMDASIDPCSTVTKIASFVEALNLNRYGNIFGRVKDA